MDLKYVYKFLRKNFTVSVHLMMNLVVENLQYC